MKNLLKTLMLFSMGLLIGIFTANGQGPDGGIFEKMQKEAIAKDKLGKALNAEANKKEIRLGGIESSCTGVKVQANNVLDAKISDREILVVIAGGIPSSGYKWHLAPGNKGPVELVVENLGPSAIPGAKADWRFVFKGTAKGTTSLRLYYARGWENVAPLKEYIINVTSAGAYTGPFGFKEDEPEEVVEPAMTEEDAKIAKALPTNFDWRNNGGNFVTSVKNQGSTSACWAFGTCANFEAVIKIKTGATRDLSEQYLCNCDAGSCSTGGWFAHWLFKDGNRGAVYESQCPFQYAGDYTCYSYTYYEKISEWHWTDGIVDTGWPYYSHNASNTQIKNAIYNYGPVAASCYAGCWANSSGIQNVNCTTGGHIVCIVGWNDSSGYWIVKNSWGTGWGASGYLYLYYNRCDMGTYSTYCTMGPLACGQSVNLHSESITNTSAYLDWDPPTEGGHKSWNVRYRKTGTTTWTTKAISASYYTASGLTLGTYYEFQVQTICTNGGTSEWTASSTFTTTGGVTDTQAPSTPTNLTAGTATSNSVALSWTASTDNVGVTGYDVYSGSTLLGTASSTSYTASGLSCSTDYTFTVKAKDAAGNASAASNAVTKTTTDCTSSCGLSVNLHSESITNTSAYLDWDPPTSGGQKSWNVRYRKTGTTTWTTKACSASYYTASGLTLGTPYEFQVQTVCTDNSTSSWTASSSFTTTGGVTDTQAPSTPTNLSSTGTTSSSVSLSWTASTDNVGVASYTVNNATSNTNFTATTNSYTVTGLAANTSYTFYVNAKDAAGNTSGWSSAVQATTSGTTVSYCTASGTSGPEYISKVVFGSINNSSARDTYHDYTTISTNVSKGSTYSLTVTIGSVYSGDKATAWVDWNNNGDFADANEKYSLTVSGSSATGSINVPTTAATASTRMRIRMFYYTASDDPCGAKQYGEVEDYTVNIAPGAAGSMAQVPDIYPNPANDVLNVDIPGANSADVTIVNMTGAVVFQNSINGPSAQIDISNLATGIYNVNVVSGGNTINKTIVKQ